MYIFHVHCILEEGELRGTKRGYRQAKSEGNREKPWWRTSSTTSTSEAGRRRDVDGQSDGRDGQPPGQNKLAKYEYVIQCLQNRFD
jgi:hypothetical protein